ncbi:MAG: PLP-dependent aminotransferase family protein [Bacillota bacterium]
MMLSLDRSLPAPLHQQLYQALRDQILQGLLTPGTRMPGSRSLADDLGVSRNVVLLAYDHLHADGLLAARHGSGSFVAGPLSPALPAMGGSPLPPPPPPDLPAPPPAAAEGPATDFRTGIPDGSVFPRSLWGRLWLEALREMPPASFGYGSVAGEMRLRVALESHLRPARGVRTTPDQIVITSGATQALSLLAELLIRPGDRVVCEDPCHPVVRAVFHRRGARVTPIPVDAEGIRVDLLEQRLGDSPARLIYLTPSHQFPTGAVLSLARRHALVALAQSAGALLIEDDYDSEIRHTGSPLPALQGLAPDRVIYVGSFSKLLAPTLRLGYAVLPAQLVDAFCRVKYTADYHTPGIEQHAMAAFMERGHYHRHLTRLVRLYRSKRAVLVGAVAEAFGGRARCFGDATGLHLWLALESRWSGSALAAAANRAGIGLYPLRDYWAEPSAEPPGCHLILGYGALALPAIRQGIGRLAEIEAGVPTEIK